MSRYKAFNLSICIQVFITMFHACHKSSNMFQKSQLDVSHLFSKVIFQKNLREPGYPLMVTCYPASVSKNNSLCLGQPNHLLMGTGYPTQLLSFCNVDKDGNRVPTYGNRLPLKQCEIFIVLKCRKVVLFGSKSMASFFGIIPF